MCNTNHNASLCNCPVVTTKGKRKRALKHVFKHLRIWDVLHDSRCILIHGSVPDISSLSPALCEHLHPWTKKAEFSSQAPLTEKGKSRAWFSWMDGWTSFLSTNDLGQNLRDFFIFRLISYLKKEKTNTKKQNQTKWKKPHQNKTQTTKKLQPKHQKSNKTNKIEQKTTNQNQPNKTEKPWPPPPPNNQWKKGSLIPYPLSSK